MVIVQALQSMWVQNISTGYAYVPILPLLSSHFSYEREKKIIKSNSRFLQQNFEWKMNFPYPSLFVLIFLIPKECWHVASSLSSF